MATFKDPHVVVKKTGYGDEHRVNYRGGREETAYYAGDKQDAHDTAKHYAKPENVIKEHEHPY